MASSSAGASCRSTERSLCTSTDGGVGARSGRASVYIASPSMSAPSRMGMAPMAMISSERCSPVSSRSMAHHSAPRHGVSRSGAGA